MIPGISCSAISISRRPYDACSILLTQNSLNPLEFFCIFSLGVVSSSELLPEYEPELILS